MRPNDKEKCTGAARVPTSWNFSHTKLAMQPLAAPIILLPASHQTKTVSHDKLWLVTCDPSLIYTHTKHEVPAPPCPEMKSWRGRAARDCLRRRSHRGAATTSKLVQDFTNSLTRPAHCCHGQRKGSTHEQTGDVVVKACWRDKHKRWVFHRITDAEISAFTVVCQHVPTPSHQLPTATAPQWRTRGH
jgi:hypothetical protein